jgi:hypothetical protein
MSHTPQAARIASTQQTDRVTKALARKVLYRV